MIHCPGCGAGLRFDIASQKMACDYCGGSYEPSEINDNSIRDDAQSAESFDGYVYVCPSCGAELITTDETDAIGFCPYCGGASMLFDKIRRQWKPEFIIPFQITKEQCKEMYVKAVKKSPFTSKKYRDPNLIEGFRGIYMPYWDYRALQRGRFYLKGKKSGIFVNRYYDINGDIDYSLDGYSHDASMMFDDRISEKLAPFDTTMHKPFAPCYLSGLYADIADVNQYAYYDRSINFMSKSTASALSKEKSVVKAKGIRKIKVDRESACIPTEISSAERVLYPVWFMSYRRKNQITYATVNGQTGKVSADLPLSPLRIMLTVLAAGALLAALLFFLPSVKANMTLAFTILLLIIGAIVLRKSFRNTVNPSTGLDQTDEAKKFQKREIIRYIFMGISAVIGFIIAIKDPAYNIISYSACLVIAAELFYLMCCHIRFQAAIAKRRPPQFNKKGAEYDEK